LKVAIVHYWLVGMRGGERVLERLLRLFPGADIFTHVYDPARVSSAIRAAKVQTTFIQRFPGARKHYQKYLPLMPRALEALDLSDYDVVISSESGPAKGIIARPDAIHLCYCHSPMRYLWDQAPLYRASAGAMARLGMDLFSHHLRIWDVTSAQRVDRFMANSTFVAQRLRKYYGRDSDIVYPPVDVDAFHINPQPDGAFLWLGQLTPYKRPDVAIDAFNKLGLPLMVVGQGELEAAMKARAKSNITFHKHLSFAELKSVYANTRGLIFTAEEDFGIVPVEVMASGRPVLAYGRGGALDTVVEDVTGQFFYEQTPEALIHAIERFQNWMPDFNPQTCAAEMKLFRPEAFDAGVMASLQSAQKEAVKPRTPAHKPWLRQVT
jgi:glycosyltransferase involved in cell wall biosynthesis